MKTRRYTEVQVFRILKELESGIPEVNVTREHGVSSATIHRWKSKYGGMTLSELKRLKVLEGEPPSSPISIIVYLVLGWLFLFLSHYKSAQAMQK